MSTINKYIVQCFLCKKESEQTRITSYSTFGYPDLDFRPAQMLRGTMEYWVQECPHCGYVNKQLHQPTNLSKEEIFNVYKKTKTHSEWRERNSDALRFAKLGAMFEKENNYIGASEQFLNVAWFYDDSDNELESTLWRRKAIECAEWALKEFLPHLHLQKPWGEMIIFELNEKEEALKKMTDTLKDLLCIYLDMQRRIGNFQPVLYLYGDLLHNETCKQLIKYQKILSLQEDTNVHTMDESKNVSI